MCEGVRVGRGRQRSSEGRRGRVVVVGARQTPGTVGVVTGVPVHTLVRVWTRRLHGFTTVARVSIDAVVEATVRVGGVGGVGGVGSEGVEV